MPTLNITTISNEALVKKTIFLAIDYGTASPDYRATSESLKAMRQQVELGQNEILRRLALMPQVYTDVPSAELDTSKWSRKEDE